MADEPYDPQKHGPLPTAAVAAVAPTEEPYDPAKHGTLPVYQPSTGQGDPDQPSAMDRPADARSIIPIAEDVLTRMASSMTFGTAEKASAYIDSKFGKGTYDAILAKRRAETEAAGQRLGTAGTIAADIAGGGLTGSALAKAPAVIGSAAPGLTALGRLAPDAPLVQKILAGAGEGGAYGALQGAGHTDTGQINDYIKNALTSGGFGALVGGAIPAGAAGAQRVITPFPATDPVRAQLAQVLQKEGINVSAGQATGNRSLRTLEDVVGHLPFGGDPTKGQMAQVTEAAMQKAGIGGGGRATPDVIDKGFNDIGGTIGKIQGQYPVHIDNEALNNAVSISNDASSLLTQPGEIATANNFIDRLTSAQQLDPDVAGALRTQLNKAIKGAGTSPNYRDVLIDIRNTLDDALARTIHASGNSGDVTALDTARRQYANLHVLADAIGSSGQSGQMGEVTPTALASALSRNLGKTSYVRGRGDMNDLARGSAALLQAPRSSQTAERWGALEPARILAGIAARPFVNSRWPLGGAQAYLGNQQARTPVPPSLLQAPVAAGASAAGANPGPADRIMQGLLMPGGP